MPRPNTPWYRASKDCWYVKLNGRMLSLSVRGKDNQQEALVAFGKLLARPVEEKPSTQPTVSEFRDRFLADAQGRLKPKTVTRYGFDTAAFCTKYGRLAATELTHHHLKEWLSAIKGTSTTKAIMLRSVSAFLGWCVKEELLPVNPAVKVPKPKTRSRSAEALISEEDHKKLLGAASKDFALTLKVLHATGCRPGEVEKMTVGNFHSDHHCCILTEHKTDRTGKPRIIFFPPEVTEELKKASERWGTGPLLRSRKGVPWSSRAILEAMRRVRERAGVKATAYGYRHSFVTSALESNLSNAVVAQLVGHTGTAVIDKHYSHLGSKADALREALKFRKVL